MAQVTRAPVGYGRLMTPSDLKEQLIKHPTDAHSIERQAVVQMKAAPKIAGDDEIAAAFERHETETEEQSVIR